MSLESLYVYGIKGSYYGDVQVQSLMIHSADSVIHCDMQDRPQSLLTGGGGDTTTAAV